MMTRESMATRNREMGRPQFDSVTVICLAVVVLCAVTNSIGLAHVLCGGAGYFVAWFLRLPRWWRLATMFVSGVDLMAGVAGAILTYFIEPWKGAKRDDRRRVQTNQRRDRRDY
jgi:hypothetical protein